MKITEVKIKVSELCEGYRDDGDGGVYGYDNGQHRLTIRPSFQREFIYKDKQRNAVIETVRKGFPLNVMYWSKVSDTEFEVLDGQQRTISLGQYLNKDFAIKVNGNDKFFHNLTDVRYTTNFIDSLVIKERSVNYDRTQIHFILYPDIDD